MNMNVRGALLPLTPPGRRVLHVASCNLPKVIRRAVLCSVFSNGRIIQGSRSQCCHAPTAKTGAHSAQMSTVDPLIAPTA